MKRLTCRLLTLLLPLALLLSIGAQAALTSPVLPRIRAYDGQFTDVARDSWYYKYAASGYEYGVFNGQGNGRFAPERSITVAELLALSARLRAAAEGDALPAAEAGRYWYRPYAAYLEDKGLLDAASFAPFNEPATRAQLAGILSPALPESCYDDRNTELVTEAYASGGFITDVDDYTPYRAEILRLYGRGLLTGMDGAGSYWPGRVATRAETAAIVMRMVDPSLRVTLNWKVLPYRSAAGTTYGDLVETPASVPKAPSVSDRDAVDAAVRDMLAAEENTLELRYNRPLTGADAAALARVFGTRVKAYCEQMYDVVRCRAYSNGTAKLTFSSGSCDSGQLAAYRAETLERAIAIHDTLWEQGYLTADMSELDIARVYFVWLCENCAYDYSAAEDDYSVSHLAYSALLRGAAVCDGYTGAYNLLLKLEGVDCYALPNDAHIWTVATLDGTEYHIDVTWGDQAGRIDMRYFAMTEEQSRAAHPW